MIEGLRDVASSRKSILYLCAGCRSIWDLFFDDSSKQAVEVAERYADGLATPEELHRANWHAECPTFGYDFQPRVWKSYPSYQRDGSLPESVKNLVKMGVLTEEQLAEDVPDVDTVVRDRLLIAARLAEAACVADPFKHFPSHTSLTEVDWPGDWLLRCVFGKPFLPAVPFDPSWATSDVVSLASAMYEGKTFDGMPILGDALEEAGCSSEDMLKHCRSEKPHVRGCWVVDLVLGKS